MDGENVDLFCLLNFGFLGKIWILVLIWLCEFVFLSVFLMMLLIGCVWIVGVVKIEVLSRVDVVNCFNLDEMCRELLFMFNLFLVL